MQHVVLNETLHLKEKGALLGDGKSSTELGHVLKPHSRGFRNMEIRMGRRKKKL
jgi:hypothetical protein